MKNVMSCEHELEFQPCFQILAVQNAHLRNPTSVDFGTGQTDSTKNLAPSQPAEKIGAVLCCAVLSLFSLFFFSGFFNFPGLMCVPFPLSQENCETSVLCQPSSFEYLGPLNNSFLLRQSKMSRNFLVHEFVEVTKGSLNPVFKILCSSPAPPVH
jgi:hypothetical protein